MFWGESHESLAFKLSRVATSRCVEKRSLSLRVLEGNTNERHAETTGRRGRCAPFAHETFDARSVRHPACDATRRERGAMLARSAAPSRQYLQAWSSADVTAARKRARRRAAQRVDDEAVACAKTRRRQRRRAEFVAAASRDSAGDSADGRDAAIQQAVARDEAFADLANAATRAVRAASQRVLTLAFADHLGRLRAVSAHTLHGLAYVFFWRRDHREKGALDSTHYFQRLCLLCLLARLCAARAQVAVVELLAAHLKQERPDLSVDAIHLDIRGYTANDAVFAQEPL